MKKIGYETTPILSLDAQEILELAKFALEHHCGRDISLEVSVASGIGRNLVARCLCGQADADITNYGAW